MSELRYCCVVADDAGKVVRNDRGACPLKSVSLTGLIRDAVAQTTLEQTYTNPLHDAAIEAVYTFPLHEGVAVVGFEAEVKGKKIVGRVQEKEAAREEYESAKEAGKVASLLQVETPDTFQASVGNIPPAQHVVIRITLVSEIKQDGDENQVRYVMPTAIAPRYGFCPVDESTISSSAVLMVDMGVAMSHAITSIQSPSHTMEVQLGRLSSDGDAKPNQARVKLTADALLDRDLVVIVQAEGLDAPHATVERHARDGTHAVALTFAPRFALNASRALELVFVVDQSGSMWGAPMRKAGAALELFLRSIPCEAHCFNVIGFGDTHHALFPRSVPYDADSLQRGARHARTMQADMGGTEMLGAVQEAFRLRRGDLPLQVFLLTDGEIWDVDSLVSAVRAAVDEGERNAAPVRVFSLGIGDSVSHHLIESVARAGSGYAQLVMESERMEKKVLNMLKSALIPPITNLHVTWTPTLPNSDEEFVLVDAHQVETSSPRTHPATPINLFSPTPEIPPPPPPAPVTPPPRVTIPIHQAPFKLPIVARGARFTFYAILAPEVPVPSDLTLQGTSPDGPVELKVAVTPVHDASTMLHALAARTVIRDLEEGTSCVHALNRDPTNPTLQRLGVRADSSPLSSTHVDQIARAQILELALRHKLSSKHTSWVAVEEDTERVVVHDVVKPGMINTDEDRYVSCGYWPYPPTSCDAPDLCFSPSSEVEKCASKNTFEVELCAAARKVELCAAAPKVGLCTAAPKAYAPKYLCVPCADEDSDDDQEVADDQSQELEGDNYVELEEETYVELEEETFVELEEETFVELGDDQTELDSLHSILEHQFFDGLFPLVPEIAAFFSTSVEELRVELATVREQRSGVTLSESEWESVWATCLAVEFMRRELAALQEEWELVVEKAERRVGALLGSRGQEMDAIKEAAAAIVTKSGGESADQGVSEAMAGLDLKSPLSGSGEKWETVAEVVVLKTTTGAEVEKPLPCLIGLTFGPGSDEKGETSAESESATGPEVKPPLPCLIGITSKPATAAGSEICEEFLAAETITGPEVGKPLPCLIGITSKPATAVGSEICEEFLAAETITGPEVGKPLPCLIGIAELATSGEQKPAEVETKNH